MKFEFDVGTAFLIVGMLYLLMPAVTWIVLAGQRTPQVMMWCAGGFLLSGSVLSYTLFAGRTGFEWVAYTLSAILQVGSSVLRIQSLRLDLGRPWRTRWMVLGVAAFSLTHVIINFGLHDIVLRVQFTFGMSGLLVGYLALLAWRIGRDEPSHSALWIAGVYFLVAAAMAFRVAFASFSSKDIELMTDGVTGPLLSVAIVLSAVVGHFGYVGMALDRSRQRELRAVAERAREEEGRRLGEQIAHLDRQRSLGEMSASLGHELNQPLSAILIQAQVARKGLRSGELAPERHVESFDRIIHNVQRARHIIERIRGFIRPSETRFEPVDITVAAREVADLVGDEARTRQVRFVFADPGQPVRVRGDAIQLSQVLLNVYRNAIEAMPPEGRREIRVTCGTNDGRAVMRIRDTGRGLPAESDGRVGTAFFSTKPGGLGMGLSISRSIIEQHSGTLTIDPAPADGGGGAVVEICLPVQPAPAT